MSTLSDSTAAGLSVRESALISAGGAGTLPVTEWETLLRQVVEADRIKAKNITRISLLWKLGCGGALVGALGHLAPAPFFNIFRLVLFVSVAVTIVGLVLWQLKKSARAPSYFDSLALPFVRTLRRWHDQSSLYLSLSTKDDPTMLTGMFVFDHARALVFSVSNIASSKSKLESAVVTVVDAENTNDPSVSGITRQVAENALAQGNPFSSLEMVALREAHELQARWTQLERFSKKENTMPPIESVIEEELAFVNRPAKDVSVDDLIQTIHALSEKSGIRLL